MLEFSDQELDRLAREAAENYDASQSPVSWDSVRQELDKSMPAGKSRDRRKFFWLFLLAAFLIGGGAYILWPRGGSKLDQKLALGTKDKDTPNSAADKNSSSAPVENRESATNSNSKQGADAKLENKANSGGQNSLAKTDASNPSSASPASSIPKPSNIKGQKPGANNSGNSNSFTSNSQRKSGKSSGRKNSNATTPNGLVLTAAGVPTYQYPDPFANNLSFSEPLIVPKQRANNFKSPAGDIARKTPEAALAKKQSSLFKQPQKGPEFSLVYAPDWSNINYTGSGEVGYNFGVLLGYNFSSRWSIETGVIYTKKNYASSGENFKFPPNYYYGDLVKAEGYCQMFDIPINVRYNAIATNKQKVFISAGLSSYLMNKEQYKFHCTNGGNYWPSWYTNEENSNYLFSIANFSFGYEYAFARHFSLLAEPYFKFALSDIGSGNAKLNSMGMYIGIKYKPSLGKPQGSPNK